MPLKLNVGLSRKVGEPNYGSRGGSVNLEVELDSSVAVEPAKLQERIRQLFGLVRTSLAEELDAGNRHSNGVHRNGANNGQERNGNDGAPQYPMVWNQSNRAATSAQVKALYAISKRQNINLTQFVQRRFQMNQPADLTVQEASRLIDELKSSPPARAA